MNKLNKKAQTLGIAIMGAIIVFIIGMMSINFLFDEVVNTRTNLDCSNAAGISDATKLLCLVIDTTIPYWIWLVFSITIGIIIARLNM